MFPMEIVKFLRTAFYIENLRWLPLKVQRQYSKVSWGICSLFWFCVFTCFRIWLKTYAKRCTNNSLLSGDKTISFLLELIYHVFSISECFGKTLVAFDFDEKLTQSIAQITMFQIAQKTNITCQKTFFACTLRLINFRIWFGKRKNAM